MQVRPSLIARPMQPVISVKDLSKSYASGFKALKNVNLDIRRGEIFALLGPNGAGKTTLIGIICGILVPTEGNVTVDGHDIIRDYRAARSLQQAKKPRLYRKGAARIVPMGQEGQ